MASVSVQSKSACPAFPFAAFSTTSGVGSLNRLLWKGYLYDKDLGCYCLGKRHYDPFALRFWEPDGLSFLDPSVPGGINPYIYCLNDPIMHTDQTGQFPIIVALIIAGAAIGAASYAASKGISYALGGEWSWSWGQFAGSVIGGAIGGAFVGLGAGPFVAGFVTGFSSTAVGMGFQNGFESTDYSAGEILLSSALSGFISGTLSKGMDFIRVPGLNAGRNSFAAITKSSITKHLNGTISSISLKTAAKALVYNAFGSVGGTIWSGFFDASDVYSKMQKRWLEELYEGLI